MPQLVTLIDGVKGDNHVCVGYKAQFDLINDKNGDTLQLYSVEAAKVWDSLALTFFARKGGGVGGGGGRDRERKRQMERQRERE